VSATVTNTGRVAGSDVAQLYLGDPASAAQPPRQLQGFQKVTLRPGQSTNVRFTLTGHSLSYWDDAANGWVLPDGQYQVYVGDSSSLTNLPLHGGFTVTRSIGARYATVSAPSVIEPGTTATVTATLVNDGDYAMPQARFGLSAPRGWTVTPAGHAPGAIGPGQTVTASFHVAVPADAEPGSHTLTARVSYRPGQGSGGGVVTGSATVAVPYASLAAANDNPGISDNSDVAGGNFDLGGDSYSAQALAAGTPTPLTPGGQVTVGGTTFTWPDVPAGQPDNVVAMGQTILLSGSGTTLGFIGAGTPGDASGSGTVYYTDGRTSSFRVTLADYLDAPGPEDDVIASLPYVNATKPAAPGKRAETIYVFYAAVPITSGRTVQAVTLPGGGSIPVSGPISGLRIFALGIGPLSALGIPLTGDAS